MTSAVGPRSKKLIEEIESLEATRAQAAEEKARLSRDVAERQSKLDVARAQGLVAKVDHDQVRAFESELEKLQSELGKARSTLGGLDAMLVEKRQALEEAKVADAREALTTKEMAAIQKGLEKNTKALEKARAAFLKALEVGAAKLLEETAPHRAQWEKLIAERRTLYNRRRQALGAKATAFDGSYGRMQKDALARRPFGDPNDIPKATELAEVLKPLLPK